MRLEVAAISASSEAVFGSAARGDADAMSDRDILIIDSDPVVLRTRARVLEADGWSVASYTFAKLEALARKGALFLQHLKLESRIVVDREDRLAKLLAAFQPHSDYSDELGENARLAALAAIVPEGNRGTLLAADILYVAVRNFGVLSLAERGVHAYSFEAIGAALEENGLIAPRGARAIAALRFLKVLYRSGHAESGDSARRAVEEALAVLPNSFFPSSLHYATSREIVEMPAPCETAASYLVLRDLERRLVALQTIGCVRDDLALLSRWIVNPRAYASMADRLAPRVRVAMLKSLPALGETRLRLRS